MAIFGWTPDFVRASVRLSGIDPARGARAAAALLARAGQSARRTAESSASTEPARSTPSVEPAQAASADPHLAAWREAYARAGLPPDTLPPPEVLAAWAMAPGGLPSQGALADLVHAFSLQHQAPVAAYDFAAIQGDLWLRPSRGCEHFLGLGMDAPVSPAFNEIILADTAETVFARHWHGRQGRAAAAGPDARDVLIHLDLLPPLADQAEALADAFIRLATGFLGGSAELRWLTWDTPQVAWSGPPLA